MGYLTDPKTFDSTENQYDPVTEISYPQQKRKIRECYYSDVVGSYIMNAVTGEKYPWKVGSFDERRFFKVTDTTNTKNVGRKGNYNSSQGRSSHFAYYETPQAYMNHKQIELDETVIYDWYDRKNLFFPQE